jgi:tetratricopeptide (TPR) repeat protein
LAVCPTRSLRDPARALAHARKAVELAPEEGEFWNTLGAAEYRTGSWDGAIGALSRSIELTSGGSPGAWLFLALAHWKKGDRAEALAWYDKAVAWLSRNKPDDEELTRFCAEVDALIRSGRPDNATPSGPDAFAH